MSLEIVLRPMSPIVRFLRVESCHEFRDCLKINESHCECLENIEIIMSDQDDYMRVNIQWLSVRGITP